MHGEWLHSWAGLLINRYCGQSNIMYHKMQNLKLMIFFLWMLKEACVTVAKLNFRWCFAYFLDLQWHSQVIGPSDTPRSMAACTDDQTHLQFNYMFNWWLVHCDSCTLCRLPDVSDRQQRRTCVHLAGTCCMSMLCLLSMHGRLTPCWTCTPD